MKHEIITAATWIGPLSAYLSWLVSAGKESTTIKLYGNHLRRFAQATALAPFAVTLQNLVDYLGSHQHWSQNTRKSHQTTLRSFYEWAHLMEHIHTNPAKLLPAVHVEPGVARPASEEAVQAGVQLIDKRKRMMVRLGAQAGLRCCEICKVSTDDVLKDLVGYTLLVHGKGSKKRLVPITDDLAQAILHYRDGDGYLFEGQIDGHLSAGYTSKLVSRALQGAATAHPLRHRFAAKAFHAGGKDIVAVKNLLGHASVATTQIYVPADHDAMRRAVAAAA